MPMKKRYKIGGVAVGLVFLASVVGNIQTIFKPVNDYTDFMVRFTTTERVAMAAQADITNYKAEEAKLKAEEAKLTAEYRLALARELGGIGKSLEAINQNITDLKSLNTKTLTIVKNELT